MTQELIMALRLLDLPDEYAPFNGKVVERTEHNFVKVIERNFDKKDPVSKRAPLVTTRYEFRPKNSFTGMYVLNYLSNYDNVVGFNKYQDGDVFKIEKEQAWVTIDIGPFAGYTYWQPWHKMHIRQVDGVYVIDQSFSRFMNTVMSGPDRGKPEVTGGANPLLSYTVEDYAIVRGTKTKPVQYQRTMGKTEALQVTGLTEEQFMYNLRIVHKIGTVNEETHIANTGGNIVISEDGNSFEYQVYINGKNIRTFDYRKLITGYNKPHPGLKIRWKLFQGDEYTKDSIYGCTWVKEYTSTEDNTINIVPGEQFSWNPATNTLTWDVNSETAMLWGESEELPAQGKNDMTQAYYNLRTGQKTITAVGDIPRFFQG